MSVLLTNSVLGSLGIDSGDTKMSRKRRVFLGTAIVLALGSFAVGTVWLGRAKQDGWVVAHMYRDLPGLGDSRQASANLESIARLEKKQIPYAYPLLFGFAFGIAALGLVPWPTKKSPEDGHKP